MSSTIDEVIRTRFRLNPRHKLSAHLFLRETFCKCERCGFWKVTAHTVASFEALRAAVTNRVNDERRARGEATLTGVPLHVESGVRCREHTMAMIERGVKTSLTSSHVPFRNTGTGRALDVWCPSALSIREFHQVALEVMEEHSPGGLGLYSWGVHIDDGAGKRPDRRW